MLKNNINIEPIIEGKLKALLNFLLEWGNKKNFIEVKNIEKEKLPRASEYIIAIAFIGLIFATVALCSNI